MPAIRRTLKNVVKNYSDAQVKVREATSNDPWGPSSTLMSEIADLTYNVIAFTDIMQMVWKRLNDDGKNWRHVYKSLVVLDYIIKTGSEKVAQQCKENFHAIKTLTSFQYIDTDNKDQGINVREKAKQLVTMLSDDERLKNERTKALKAKERFAQNSMGVGNGPGRAKVKDETKTEGSPIPGGSASPVDTQASPGSASTPNEIECARPSSAGEEELQLQLALAMSKEEHDETLRKQKSDDIKLQMAIEQSREQVKTPGGGTLLHLAGPSTSHGASAASASATKDPWGAPLPSSQPAPAPTDPWGAPLPPPAAKPDPWGSSPSGGGGGRIDLPPAYSPSFNAPPPATTPPQPADPWGLPPPEPAATANAPLAGAWASSPTSSSQQASAWGGPSSASAGAGLDAFGAPATNGTSGGVATIDSEFDLLSARSNESSPVKSSTAAQGLEEFDLLSGGNPTNGTSAWDNQNKKKKAEDFLGDNANLVNLDQLVSKAPPKEDDAPNIPFSNNPFAMTVGNSNPFQDPNAGVRVPMAQMQGTANAPAPGFSQPISSGLLPSPLVPSGTQPMQPMPQPQQGYNPFL